jgi:hypothetical protein
MAVMGRTAKIKIHRDFRFPFPMVARSKPCFYDLSLVGMTGSTPIGAWMLVCDECCVLSDFSATCRFPVQRSPPECECVTERAEVQQYMSG